MKALGNPRAAVAAAFVACLSLLARPAVAASNPFDQRVKPIQIGDQMPAMGFVDQRGRRFSFASLRGQAVAVGFIYTRCDDACPIITQKFGVLDRKLGAGPYHLVEVTIDPAYDTPSVLAAYSKKYGATSPRWDMLTGDPGAVSTFVRSAGLSVVDSGHGELIHNARLLVVSPDGRLADIVELVAWDPATLAAVLQHEIGAASSPLARADFELTKAVAQICGGSYQIASGIIDVVAVLLITAGGLCVLLWMRRHLLGQGA